MSSEMSKEKILQLFEETGGILSGHFLLTSGRHSDKYMQCAKLFTRPETAERVCAELAKKLDGLNADIVISPAVGGILMGFCMAKQLKVENIFAERINGEMELRRGFELKPGQRVIVVEDVVTTGGSARDVVTLAQNMGAEVVAVASLVDRSNGKVDFGVRFEALLSMDVTSYEADSCPICKKGMPLVKPGSRNFEKK